MCVGGEEVNIIVNLRSNVVIPNESGSEREESFPGKIPYSQN